MRRVAQQSIAKLFVEKTHELCAKAACCATGEEPWSGTFAVHASVFLPAREVYAMTREATHLSVELDCGDK